MDDRAHEPATPSAGTPRPRHDVAVDTQSDAGWLLLIYKVPHEPSANRVSTWRKLKRLGAILLHDAAWVLPSTPRTREQLQWLASDIRDLGGEAFVWRGEPSLDGQEGALQAQFLAQVDARYTEILTALEQPDPDLAVLSRRYQQARAQDFFNSPLGQRARAALLAAGGGAA
jgi:ChrB-like protein